MTADLATHVPNHARRADLYQGVVIETVPDLEDIRFDGYMGRYGEIARMIQNGRLYVQMESNIFGDEAAYLIVDGVTHEVLVSDSHNSLHEDLDDWLAANTVDDIDAWLARTSQPDPPTEPLIASVEPDGGLGRFLDADPDCGPQIGF